MNKAIKIVIILIFLAGAVIRAFDVSRPIDHASWRENDLGAISRNYELESMNPFYPRIDWRGTTPGYAEMELPLYPYLIAVTYKIFGIHDYFGRVWAFVFSLLTLFIFYRLAREHLSGTALVCAFLFFTFNPLIVEFSTAIQPEGLMILFYVTSVYFFLKWLKTGGNKDFWLAAVVTGMMLLSKATAAHVGLFFCVLLLRKFGLKVFTQSKVWLFGIVSLLPALAWYVQAKTFWTNYGNSLGVSNEYHWVGWDFFTNSYFIRGIIHAEIFVVWVSFGAVVGIFAAWRGFGERFVNYLLLWFVSIFVFYIIAARTTADDWASYYHIFSIPPAALLFGFGVGKLLEMIANFFSFQSVLTNREKSKKVVLISVTAIAVFGTFALEAREIRENLLEDRTPDKDFVCAKKIKSALEKEGLILVSGGHCRDADGYRVAYNASYMFYWLERKGFNDCVEEQSIEKVREFAGRGAKYYVAQKSNLADKLGFAAELARDYPVVAECDEFTVYDLGD